MMRAFWADVWWSIRSAPGRAALAFGSLALGLFSATVLLSGLLALNRQADSLLEAFGAETSVLLFSGDGMTPELLARVRAAIGPRGVAAPFRVLPSSAGESWTRIACDAELPKARRWRVLEGRALDDRDDAENARHVVAPDALCRRMNWRVGQSVLLGRESYVLVGRLADVREEVVFPAASVFLPVGAAGVQQAGGIRWGGMILRAASGVSPEYLRDVVTQTLLAPGGLNQREELECVTPDMLLSGIRQWQRMVAWTAGMCGALGLALGASLLAGMLASAVRARTREIGLRRALGATRWDVAALFVAEAVLLTTAAGICGVVLAEGLLRVMGGRIPFPYAFDWTTRLLPVLVSLGVGICCSLAPALYAARLAPAESLRND